MFVVWSKNSKIRESIPIEIGRLKFEHFTTHIHGGGCPQIAPALIKEHIYTRRIDEQQILLSVSVDVCAKECAKEYGEVAIYWERSDCVLGPRRCGKSRFG